MKESIFVRLNKYYTAVGLALAGKRDLSVVLPNPTDKGLSREAAYAEVLRQHLPSTCEVQLGGFLFGQNGDESKQIDIFVTSDLALQYGMAAEQCVRKSFACIDSTVGVASVKTMLDRGGLRDTLNCIASLPSKLPLEGRVPKIVQLSGYEEWPFKVIFALDGLESETIRQHVEEFYSRNTEIPPQLRPNLIHVLGKYCIKRIAAQGEETRLGKPLDPNTFVVTRNNPDFFGLVLAITQMHKIAMSMRWVLTDYAEMFDKIPLS